jgi:hypothetical protein
MAARRRAATGRHPALTRSRSLVQRWLTRRSLLSALCFLSLLFLYAAPFSRSLAGWPLGELLVNYQGGFVRRGLLGELIFQASSSLDLSPIGLLRALFVVLSILNLLIFVSLSSVEQRPIKRLLLLFAPALLLFPVYDFMAYGRKDVITTALLGIHAIIAQQTLLRRFSLSSYRRLLVAVIIPLLIANLLTHDVQIFFIPFHFIITWQLYHEYEATTRRHIAFSYLAVVGVSLLPIIFSGNRDVAIAVCNSWHELIDDFAYCYKNSKTFDQLVNSGIKALGWSIQRPWGHTSRLLQNGHATTLFLVSLMLSVVPYFILYRVSYLYRKPNMKTIRGLGFLLPVSLMAPLALFFIGGWDYGRWIHLITSALFAVTYANPRLVNMRVPFDAVVEGATRRELLPYLLLAGLYVGAWYVPHCCQPSSIYGGMHEALGASFRVIFGE